MTWRRLPRCSRRVSPYYRRCGRPEGHDGECGMDPPQGFFVAGDSVYAVGGGS